jgi:hypothetical protein
VFVESHISNIFFGAVYRTVVAIESYEGPSKDSEFVEANYPGVLLSDLRLAITTSKKSGKAEKPDLELRFCTYRVDWNWQWSTCFGSSSARSKQFELSSWYAFLKAKIMLLFGEKH